MHRQERSPGTNPCVFLDRDGTINKEVQYLHEAEKFEFEVRVPEALKMLQYHGFKLVVISNQGAIGKGMYTSFDVEAVHARMNALLAGHDVKLDGIYYCPHSAQENCNCRKPRTGLILQAMKEHGIDKDIAWMVGDKLSDIQAGNSATLRTILLQTGYGRKELEKLKMFTPEERRRNEPTWYCADLLEAAIIIIKETQTASNKNS